MDYSIVVDYLENIGVTNQEYIDFLSGYFKGERLKTQLERIQWYKEWGKYRILVAKLNGKLIGQSCAFGVTAVLNGKEIDWWWSVDTFVLEEARGMGLGKKLQGKLHEDFENFSSLSYTKANEYVKRKVGSREFCKVNYCYYPCYSFLSIIFNAVRKKSYHAKLRKKFSFYPILNHVNMSLYEVKDVIITKEIENNIMSYLSSNYTFFIRKDIAYLEWKYKKNPTIGIDSLGIYKNGILSALVFVSKPGPIRFLTGDILGVKILDRFVFDNKIKDKEILAIIREYYKRNGFYLDGIRMLSRCSYIPCFIHPKKGHILLSNCVNVPSGKVYFGFGDQDIELPQS